MSSSSPDSNTPTVEERIRDLLATRERKVNLWNRQLRTKIAGLHNEISDKCRDVEISVIKHDEKVERHLDSVDNQILDLVRRNDDPSTGSGPGTSGNTPAGRRAGARPPWRR